MNEKGTKFDRDNVSVTGSNYDRRSNTPRRNIWNYAGSGDQSPLSASPESQTVNSFAAHDSFLDSPFSTNQASPEHGYDRRSVNRKLWSRCENGADVNISLVDGIFSEITSGSAKENSEQNEYSGSHGDYANGFAGFLQDSARNRGSRSPTPSPQRSRSLVNVDNSTIFLTPRKLLRSLQDPNEESPEQDTRFRSHSSAYKKTPTSKYVHSKNGNLKSSSTTTTTDEELQGSTESISSTEGSPSEAKMVQRAASPKLENDPKWKLSPKMVGALLVVLLAIIACMLFINDQEETPYLVPT